ncbi:chromate transporter, partial [Microbacterium sp.]|uniref:chromate transporter n=1 Tax=Microbacterium sp. TaxID=51671 RepID=UPI003C759D82
VDEVPGLRTADAVRFPVRPAAGLAAGALFIMLLVGSPLVAAATGSGSAALFAAFFRAGSLVFGGGHVVLPLLQSAVVDAGWTTDAQFLAGYGAAQAVPGPLFTFAAYLGAIAEVGTGGPGGIGGALVALAGIFLTGFLLLVAVLPFWNTLQRYRWAQAAMRGANAAVVGIPPPRCTPPSSRRRSPARDPSRSPRSASSSSSAFQWRCRAVGRESLPRGCETVGSALQWRCRAVGRESLPRGCETFGSA